MKRFVSAIGPALIVAAVVLGPGSILTSSKVGAEHGLLGIPIIVVAALLMMSMVALAARLGAVCEHSLCTELARRLGRPVAVAIGLVLFALVAIFQLSNNVSVVGGIEPLWGNDLLPFSSRVAVLAVVNLTVISCLYGLRNLYSSIEQLMKVLIGVMVLAFVGNLGVVLWRGPTFEAVESGGTADWLSVLGLIGTTFSVGGAFYQAYLVREKGWGIGDVRRSSIDSVLSISILGMITCIILLTSCRVFHGNPNRPQLESVGDVARILEPSFGSPARVIFAGGILAGALSSFLGNALIGGTILSDALGKGARLSDRWPLHFTTAALVVGFAAAVAALHQKESTVNLITLAQALTVLGMPAIAASLVYLATRPDVVRSGQIPGWLTGLAIAGLCASVFVASQTLRKVREKVAPQPEQTEQTLRPSSHSERVV